MVVTMANRCEGIQYQSVTCAFKDGEDGEFELYVYI